MYCFSSVAVICVDVNFCRGFAFSSVLWQKVDRQEVFAVMEHKGGLEGQNKG